MTNYVGMRLGDFEVIGYNIRSTRDVVDIKVRCSKCNNTFYSEINPDRCIRLQCKNCERFKYILVLAKRYETELPLDIVAISEYKYRKLRKKYKNEETEESWQDYLIASCKK